MKTMTRRQILIASAGAAATIPLGVFRSSLVVASDAPRLDPEDPQAQALAYVHVSATEGQNCANCRLYTGEADAEWDPCAIFPGKQVAAEGWCLLGREVGIGLSAGR